MVKDHSVVTKGNPLLPLHGILFPISTKSSFIWIVHTTAFGTPVVEYWLEQEIAQWVHHEGSIQQPITLWVEALPLSCISLHISMKILPLSALLFQNDKTIFLIKKRISALGRAKGDAIIASIVNTVYRTVTPSIQSQDIMSWHSQDCFSFK